MKSHEYADSAWGLVSLETVARHLTEEARQAISEIGSVKTLLCCVVPYFAGAEPGNISVYARGRDYHKVVMRIMNRGVKRLMMGYPQNFFVPLVDVSPFPEVVCAAAAGLGVMGKNGLLITEKWGSYVFIGIVATDFEYSGRDRVRRCIGCGACQRTCPVGLNMDKCLSHLTQKRGELDIYERNLVKNAPLVWGCDICQTACPMNKGAELTDISDFRENLLFDFPKGDLGLSDKQFRKNYANNAFSWRGIAPIRRNFQIKESDMDITIRHATVEDLDSVIAVESTCFPAGEAASPQSLKKRLEAYKTCFFVAEHQGEIVGFVNGSAVDGNEIFDELFENIALHDENGQWQSIFGLDVIPGYRRQGIAEALMNTIIDTARKNGKKGLFLDCKEHLVHYYEKFGYKKSGLSKSVLGGAVWYDMVLTF